ncbi:MAG TPA: polyribonucleotide nucleotidyltransferase, partial [Acidimicrobiales bacterium]|nr:polyribonucleotide nucleotidyltransferase [Acidimicrobiales bacterium]
AVEVRVDDIDPQGKVSLSLANAPEVEAGGGSDHGGGRSDRADRPSRPERASGPAVASFEDAFEAELTAELGDLGPGAPAGGGGEGRGDGGDRRRSRNRPPRRR